MTTNVYIAADTGGSGFGVAAKGLIKQLLKRDNFKVTLRTHQWGWNEEGHKFDESLGDSRFKHFIWKKGYVNEDYISETSRGAVDRQKETENLLNSLGTNREVDSKECMVKQFEGKEDVWIAIGGKNFAEQAPEDDDVYTILSTDYNLDLVPREWAHYLKKVDEVWVPSEWTYNSIKNRFEETYPDIVEKTEWFHYGVRMGYKPTKYDCFACPNERHGSGDIVQQPCLKDEKFTFLVVSRFYHIKGVYRTIKAFLNEFRGSEDVRLFFKTTSNNQFEFDPSQTVKTSIKELGYPDPPEVGIKKDLLPTQSLYDLYGQADCFVQASRAECFGIAQLEAAYCGTPVIYTDWSSQAEVMDGEIDGMYPVKDYNVETCSRETRSLAFSGDSFPPDGKWAVPSIEELGNRMREVFEKNKETLEKEGKANTRYVEENYQWEEKAEKRIQRIKKAGGKDE